MLMKLFTVAALALMCLVPTSARAAVATCPAFNITLKNGDGLRATDVERSSRIRCSKARTLLRAAYGRGRVIKTVYEMRDADGNPVGRPTYWLRGGWRCGNGAGGAACWNARHRRFNAIKAEGLDHGMAVTASTG
jgi:hypothetical protein